MSTGQMNGIVQDAISPALNLNVFRELVGLGHSIPAETNQYERAAAIERVTTTQKRIEGKIIFVSIVFVLQLFVTRGPVELRLCALLCIVFSLQVEKPAAKNQSKEQEGSNPECLVRHF